MATRYYTEEAYEQIRNTIDQIQSSDLDPVVDFFSDLLGRIAQYLELYTVEDYQQDIQTWYTKVLDSHNTTMANVDSIFNAVESVDFEYRDIMMDARSSIVNFRSAINCLRDIISGKTSMESGKAAADKYLTDGKNALYASYDAILTKMEAKVLGQASLELTKDALKFGAGFGKMLSSFAASVFTLNPTKAVIASKEFIDTCIATMGDLGAIVSVGLGAAAGYVGAHVGMSYKEYLDIRFTQLSDAKSYKDKNSVTDWLEESAEGLTEDLAECPEDSPFYPVMKKAAETAQNAYDLSKNVDTVADTLDLINGISDSVEEMDEWINGKDYTLAEYLEESKKRDFGDTIRLEQSDDGLIITETIPPSKIISKIISDRTGIPLSGWEDPDKAVGNGFKLAGTIFSYGEKLDPDLASYASGDGDVTNVAIGKVKEIGTVKDGLDLIRDLGDRIPNSEPIDVKQPNSYMQYDRDLHTWSKVCTAPAGAG